MSDQQHNTTTGRVEELLSAGRLEEAKDLCRRSCQVSDAGPEDWLLYGCVSADTGDSAMARMALVKATELDPDFVEAQFGLGKLLVALGDNAAAIAPFQKAAQLQPDNAEIWLALGITCGLAEQTVQAEECCRRSLVLQPGSAQAHFNLANALRVQGKLSEAEVEYEATLEIDPTLAIGWSKLSQVRVGLGKSAEAEAAALRALSLDSLLGEAHFTLGNILADRGELEKARDYFRQAVERLPELPDAHLRLAQILHQLEELPAALESCQRVVSLDPGWAEAHFLMGECLSFQQVPPVKRKELSENAEKSYRQAVTLNNDHLQAHYRLVFLYLRWDRNAEAAKHLAEILRINPKDEQARHLLAAQQGSTTATAPPAYVATLFDGFADSFDAKMVETLNYHTPELLCDMVGQLALPSANSLDVVDLGCGTGLCAPLFRGMARRLHGVDLSPLMIEKARERALYDSLEVGDIVAALKSKAFAWDLAISADVFIYVGALEEVFAACGSALKPGGYLAFSIEAGDDSSTFVLRPSGRYAHATEYIRSLAASAGLQEVGRRAAFLRHEHGKKVAGFLFLMRRPFSLPESAYRIKYIYN